MKLYIKIIIHSIFWMVFLAVTIATAYIPDLEPHVENKTPHIIINIFWAIVVFYLFYKVFIKYFERGKFVIYFLLSIGISILITFLFMPLHKLFFAGFTISNINTWGPPMIGSFILAQCGSLVKGFENWVDNIKLKAELENRNLKNELELLKSQINPHFLFNTLNNIDALIHKSPDDASRSLLSLSDMLRYMIYETNIDFVPLHKEIEYLKHYIKLQRLRLREPDFINIELVDKANEINIAPIILLPFVENAFKYASNEGKLPVIDIRLTNTGSRLIFTCMNYYNIASAKKIEWSGGVGLENVKRRLELLYPQKHKFSVTDENSIFRVELILEY